MHIHAGGICGIMVTVEGKECSDPRSNPRQGCLHFSILYGMV